MNANGQKVSTNNKPTVIFFHTDWCSYCKIQQKQIEKDAEVSFILKNHYNFIDFDAESQQEKIYNNKRYKPVKNSTHEFVKMFFPKSSQIAYPLWIILDQNQNIIFKHEGLIKLKDLKKILTSKELYAN